METLAWIGRAWPCIGSNPTNLAYTSHWCRKRSSKILFFSHMFPMAKNFSPGKFTKTFFFERTLQIDLSIANSVFLTKPQLIIVSETIWLFYCYREDNESCGSSYIEGRASYRKYHGLPCFREGDGFKTNSIPSWWFLCSNFFCSDTNAEGSEPQLSHGCHHLVSGGSGGMENCAHMCRVICSLSCWLRIIIYLRILPSCIKGVHLCSRMYDVIMWGRNRVLGGNRYGRLEGLMWTLEWFVW